MHIGFLFLKQDERHRMMISWLEGPWSLVQMIWGVLTRGQGRTSSRDCEPLKMYLVFVMCICVERGPQCPNPLILHMKKLKAEENRWGLSKLI